jgi:hypothetical protein
MKLSELVEMLEAKVMTPSLYDPNKEVDYAFSCDLMSDALMLLRNAPLYFCDNGVLVTGLVTIQGIRTAEMLDMDVVVVVRNKIPSEGMISEAIASGVIVLQTSLTMFSTNGRMYQAGIRGISDLHE